MRKFTSFALVSLMLFSLCACVKESENTSSVSHEEINSQTVSTASTKTEKKDGSSQKDTSKTTSVISREIKINRGDYATPDEDVDENFGTVPGISEKYNFKNKVFAEEYINRDGIKNTIHKLHNGENVTIAYLGGSITQENSWRLYTTQWFEVHYGITVNEINLGLAGTQADLAVCRYDTEVKPSNPDLVFIEYTVNGGRACDLEGLIRKIWKYNPKTDICFVYTSTVDTYNTYANGKLPNMVSLFEKVADYYNIPSVFLVKQPFDLYEQDRLTLVGSSPESGKILYSKDGTHLTGDGGMLGAGSIARSIINMEKTYDKSIYKPVSHTVPYATYDKAPWVDATESSDWSKMKFEGDWFDCVLKSGEFTNFPYTDGYLYMFKRLFTNLKATKTAGSSITIKFNGTDIGIFEAGGQYSGQLKVYVDGKEQTKKLVLYEKNYDSKLRHQYYFINSLPKGEHTVKFVLDSQMPDKSSLKRQNPSDPNYDKNELYIGRILLNGTLLDANK